MGLYPHLHKAACNAPSMCLMTEGLKHRNIAAMPATWVAQDCKPALVVACPQQNELQKVMKVADKADLPCRCWQRPRAEQIKLQRMTLVAEKREIQRKALGMGLRLGVTKSASREGTKLGRVEST